MITTQHLTTGALTVGGIAVVGAIVAGMVAPSPDVPPEHNAWIPVDDSAGDGRHANFILDTPIATRSDWEAMADQVAAIDPDAEIMVSAPIEIEGLEGFRSFVGSDTAPSEIDVAGQLPREGEVFLARTLADDLGLTVGDNLLLRSGRLGDAPFPALTVTGLYDSDASSGLVSLSDGWAIADAYAFTGVIDTYLAWDGEVPEALAIYTWDED